MLYNNLSTYLKNKYGKKIGKICIDGGFTCPNRDGKCGTGGCIYCGERGAGEHINGAADIKAQVAAGLKNPKYAGFIAYFQSFTNTYAGVEELKEKYDSALADEKIVALAIGTRPDCIDDEIAALIASYKDRVDVWVELGLQTASDTVAEIIGRGYKTEVFVRAAEILNRYGIPFVVHMIIGLPGESEGDPKATARLINESGAFGIKIHSIYVMNGTRLADLYKQNLYTPPTLESYVNTAVGVLEILRPDITVHRLTGDCPRGMLLAPDWNADKNAIIKRITDELSVRGTRQGSLYGKD